MGSQAETAGGLLARYAQEFDPIKFYSEIFNIVNRCRSEFEIRPGALVTSTKDLGSGSGGESFVNAFYRVMGLPAVSNGILGVAEAPEITNPYTAEQIFRIRSQSETLNLFTYDEVVTLESEDAFTLNVFVSREDALRAPDQFVKQGKTEELKKRSVQFFSDPLDIGAANDRKPSIFPMVVAADVPVYPQSLRVAPLFYMGDFISDSGVRCPRSFLETVIYMRTFQFSGQLTQLQEALRISITQQLERAQTDNVSDIVGQIDEFGLLELQLINKFLQAIQRSAVGFYRTRELLTKLLKDTSFYPVIVASDPNAKRGELSLTNEEVAGVVSANVDLQSKVFVEDIKIPKVDQAIANIQDELAKADLFISLLPTEQLKKSDEIRRIADENPTLSLTDDVFSNVIVSLLTFERNALEDELAKLEKQRQVFKQQLDGIRRSMQIYTGEPLGLSIFDILAVFLALFTVDIEDLYGLLNAPALERFSANTSITSLFGTGAGTVELTANPTSVALQNLQAKVREYLALSVKFYTAAATVAEAR